MKLLLILVELIVVEIFVLALFSRKWDLNSVLVSSNENGSKNSESVGRRIEGCWSWRRWIVVLMLLKVLVDFVVREEVVVRVGGMGVVVRGGRSFALETGVEEGGVEVGIVFGERGRPSDGIVVSEI